MKIRNALSSLCAASVLSLLVSTVFAGIPSAREAKDLSGGNGSEASLNAAANSVMDFTLSANNTDATTGNCATNPTSGANGLAPLPLNAMLNAINTTNLRSEPAREMLVSGVTSSAANNNGGNNSNYNNNSNRNNNYNPSTEGNPPEREPSQSVTPEPATMLIFGLGLAGLVPLVRSKRRK